MSWTTPITWGSTVLTSPTLNAQVRDNMNVLKASLDDNGHLRLPTIQTKTGDYTVLTTDDIVRCNGTFTVTLYAAAGNVGKIVIIKNIGTGVVTIDGNGSDTIDGALTFDIYEQEALLLYAAASGLWESF